MGLCALCCCLRSRVTHKAFSLLGEFTGEICWWAPCQEISGCLSASFRTALMPCGLKKKALRIIERRPMTVHLRRTAV